MHSLYQFVENLRIPQIYYSVRYPISTFLFGTPARCRALINLVGPRSYGFEDRSYRRIVRQRYIYYLEINFLSCQQDSNLQHACLSYVTAFKDRKLFQLSYDIMYDGFSHCRVFPCLVIINTTIKPLLSMSLLPFYRRAVGCCLMTGRLSEFH